MSENEFNSLLVRLFHWWRVTSERAHAVPEALRPAVERFQEGRLEDAEALCRQVLQGHPDYTDALNLLGVIELELGRPANAEQLFRRATALQPANAAILSNLGNALLRIGRPVDAESCYRRAIALKPDFAEAHGNLGNALLELERAEEAAGAYRDAIALKPDYADARNNLGNALRELGRAEQAEASCRDAIALRPDFAEAHLNLAAAQQELGRLVEAEASYRRALALNPGLADARRNLACLLLATGRFEEGFREYEWRIKADQGVEYLRDPRDPARVLPRPSVQLPIRWRDRRVLLLPDQGLGDNLFFLRFAADLRALGARLALCTLPKLRSLLERSGWVDELVEEPGSATGFDLAFFTCDLGLLAGARTAKAEAPRLAALPARLEAMRRRLEAFGPSPWIGATWRAGIDRIPGKRVLALRKQIDPSLLGQMLASIDARVIVIQRGSADSERSLFEAALGRPALDLSAASEDLEDMCALLALLDDYVGVSNTNMHLLAALGRTARVLVPWPAEWRWMAQGTESPWFPGFRLYRQSRGAAGWAEALSALRAELGANPGARP
jgi:Flp pilus assembly protein TadD